MHNILLAFGGHIKLSDYMWPSLCPSATFAKDGSSGRVLYAAPEVFEGRMVPKSDVWSLGIILIHLAEGVKPYEGCSNLGELRRSVCEGQAPSLQGGKWSPFLMDFVQRCMAKNVEERWSVAELLQVDSSLCE